MAMTILEKKQMKEKYIAVNVPWVTLSKDPNVEKKERTWTLAKGLW